MSFRVEELVITRGGRRILDGVSLAPAPGRTTVLVGPSGSGKTTLLRLVLGLDAPDSGRVLIGERIATDGRRVLVPPEARGLSVVFQDLALWPHLSVEQNLAFVLAAAGVARRERAPRISEMLREVGLPDAHRRRPGELSGGERQRVALGRALVAAPTTLLFDEPLASLDVVTRREIRALLRRLLAERGATALYVTHDPEEIEGLAEPVAVLERGRIVQSATMAELCQTPATPFIAALSEHWRRRCPV